MRSRALYAFLKLDMDAVSEADLIHTVVVVLVMLMSWSDSVPSSAKLATDTVYAQRGLSTTANTWVRRLSDMTLVCCRPGSKRRRLSERYWSTSQGRVMVFSS